MKIFTRALLLFCVSFVAISDRAQVATPSTDTATPKQIAAMRAKLADWPQLGYYREANAALPPSVAGEERVVFYGASVA
ncbi:MAG: hypothetical protein ACYCSN_09675 [Acidobacteriaceae bacterium]